MTTRNSRHARRPSVVLQLAALLAVTMAADPAPAGDFQGAHFITVPKDTPQCAYGAVEEMPGRAGKPGGVVAFRRDASTGMLTPIQCIANGECGASGLGRANGLLADARRLYATGSADNDIVAFARSHNSCKLEFVGATKVPDAPQSPLYLAELGAQLYASDEQSTDSDGVDLFKVGPPLSYISHRGVPPGRMKGAAGLLVFGNRLFIAGANADSVAEFALPLAAPPAPPLTIYPVTAGATPYWLAGTSFGSKKHVYVATTAGLVRLFPGPQSLVGAASKSDSLSLVGTASPQARAIYVNSSDPGGPKLYAYRATNSSVVPINSIVLPSDQRALFSLQAVSHNVYAVLLNFDAPTTDAFVVFRRNPSSGALIGSAPLQVLPDGTGCPHVC